MKRLLLLLALGAFPAAAQQAPARIDLRSETLVVDHKARQATFSGGVVATRGELELRCPEVLATYDAASQVRRVVCEGPVEAREGEKTMRALEGEFDNVTGILTLRGEPVFTEGERRLEGETLIYDATARTLRLEKAKGSLPAEDAPNLPGAAGRGPLLVESERILHELDTRRSLFEGGVVARRGDLFLRADKLTAISDEESKLQRAFTSGGRVDVRQRDRRGTAARATFTAGAERLVLDGDPQVEEGASSLRGERVIFLLGADRVQVEKPRAVFPLGAALPGGKK